MQKTLSSQTLRLAVVALENMNVDMNQVLKDAQISRLKLANPMARVPIEKELLFWKVVKSKVADPHMTLRMAENVPFGTFALLEYIGASCQSIHQALVFFCKYAELIYGNWYPTLTEKGQIVKFDLGSEGDPEDFRFTNEFGLAMMYKRLADFAGAPLPLTKVHFKHKLKGSASEFRKFFGSEVLFDQDDNSLFFDKKIKKTPCKNSDSFLLGSMLNLAEKLTSKIPGKSKTADSSFVIQIKEALRKMLHDGEPDTTKLAKDLGMSTRSLQRKLAEEGTSISDLIVGERKVFAVELLKSPDLTNEDIALMLGYSTLSAFNKAFRQWFKMTPSEFRKTL